MTEGILRWSDFAYNYIGFALELLADSVKTEETDQQHTISDNNIQNELLSSSSSLPCYFCLIDIHAIDQSFFNQPYLHMNNQASNKNLLDNVTIATLELYTQTKN